jgi:hypothetical protein
MTLVSGDGQAARAGTLLPDELVIRVTDVNGNPILGATVLWRVTSGGGQIDPASVGGGVPGESITDPGGFNTADWTLGATVGEQTVQVSSLVTVDVVTFTATATEP